MASCPTQSQLEDLIAGRLSEEQHEALEEHVQGCEACQALIVTIDEPDDPYCHAVHELARMAALHIKRPLQAIADFDSLLTPHADNPLLGDGNLGDFRILRPVGRGGMGIVYEAQQLSVGRRVALKTLPFAGELDPRRL